jgi:RNA polymerase sigma factor (sigma-70 family)
MQIVHPNKRFEQTLESMFAAKYSWVLRWALHFTQNDRAAAEDLVQETFVRILLLKDSLRDLDNIEPLLYTHLRYAHLTERRRGRHHAFQSLASVDFDTLSISLRTTATFDQIEVQNELRKILVFLLWRRRAAKFANMFLLRFFHELSHEEIAAVCLVSRHAVDLGLARARNELKAYLANPQQTHVLGRGNVPECKAQNTAVTSDKFATDMMLEIFGGCAGGCLNDRQLEQLYRVLNLRPVENDLLSHFVSCKICLDRVTRICGSTPPSGPGSGISRGLALLATKQTAARGEKKALARIFEHGKRRMRETFNHHPSDLVIAVNGEVVAVRDISSQRAVLKVESHAAAALELVEIFSEQGILLSMLPIATHPPFSPPEVRSDVELSGGRMLSLCIRFTCDGALIEAIYLDPNFATDDLPVFDDAPADHPDVADIPALCLPDPDSVQAAKTRAGQPLLRRLIDSIGKAKTSLRTLVALPVALAIIALVFLIAIHFRTRITADNLLRDAMLTESRLRAAYGSGAVHQRIEIRAAGHTIHREVYRDLDGRRHSKVHALDPDEQLLRAKLAEAQVDWNDPLSVANFDLWQVRVAERNHDVSRVGPGLLTVSATASSGPVLRQTVTIRLSDLHTVARSVLFRDQQDIELAELSYEVVPWGPDSEGWFDPVSVRRNLPARRRLNPSFSAPAPPVSDDQLDEAELGVLVAMQELHGDTERLQVSRTPQGIVVNGIVESDSRKSTISSRLSIIPYVLATIWSYRDFESKSNTERGPTTVKAISVAAQDSPLDRYCQAQHLARDSCRQAAHQILNSSATLVRESRCLRDLEAEFPPSRALSPGARGLLNELTALHMQHMLAAIHDQEDSLPVLGAVNRSGVASPDSPAPELVDLVQHNLMLATELVYAENERGRDATLILQDLTTSAWELRAAASHNSRSATNHPDASPSVLAPQPQ